MESYVSAECVGEATMTENVAQMADTGTETLDELLARGEKFLADREAASGQRAEVDPSDAVIVSHLDGEFLFKASEASAADRWMKARETNEELARAFRSQPRYGFRSESRAYR